MTRVYQTDVEPDFFRFECRLYDGRKAPECIFSFTVADCVPSFEVWNKRLLAPSFNYELSLFMTRALRAYHNESPARFTDLLNENDNSLPF